MDFSVKNKDLNQTRKHIYTKTKKAVDAQTTVNVLMKQKGLDPKDYEPVVEPDFSGPGSNEHKLWTCKKIQAVEPAPKPQAIPDELFKAKPKAAPKPKTPKHKALKPEAELKPKKRVAKRPAKSTE